MSESVEDITFYLQQAIFVCVAGGYKETSYIYKLNVWIVLHMAIQSFLAKDLG